MVFTFTCLANFRFDKLILKLDFVGLNRLFHRIFPYLSRVALFTFSFFISCITSSGTRLFLKKAYIVSSAMVKASTVLSFTVAVFTRHASTFFPAKVKFLLLFTFLFRRGGLLFRSGGLLFRSGGLLFRSGRLLFRSGRLLFCLGRLLFRPGGL